MNAPVHSELARSRDGTAVDFAPGSLWSLWDLLKENASDFMDLGMRLYDLTVIFGSDEEHPIDPETGVRKLNEAEEKAVRGGLRELVPQLRSGLI